MHVGTVFSQADSGTDAEHQICEDNERDPSTMPMWGKLYIDGIKAFIGLPPHTERL